MQGAKRKIMTWTEVMQENSELVAASTVLREAVINNKIAAHELVPAADAVSSLWRAPWRAHCGRR